MGKIQGTPKEEIQNNELGPCRNPFKYNTFTDDFITCLFFSHQIISSEAYHYPNHCTIMQSVELYNPNSPNLHLTLFAAIHSLSEDVNQLNYQLMADDFITLIQPEGQLLYMLNPSTTTLLFWALHCLARYIVRATSHGLHNDPTIPFASKGYIPQI